MIQRLSLFQLFTVSLLLMTNQINAQVNILVCGSFSDLSWGDDVQEKLQQTGFFNSVDIFNSAVSTPSLMMLQGYNAVLNYTDGPVFDANELGDLLAQYIDQGGAVVNCVFANAGVPVGGSFNTPTYQVVEPLGQFLVNDLELGSVLDPCHPIINGITEINSGTNGFISSSTTLTPSSQLIANWSNDTWLVAVKENVGPAESRRVDLNFFPPSSNANPGLWPSSSQGALLMANALLWASETGPEVVLNGIPGNISVEVNNLGCSAIVSWLEPTPCPGTTISSTHSPGSAFPLGVTTVTYTAEDVFGNSVSDSFNIDVTSNLSLSFINVNPVQCHGGTQGSTVTAFANGTAPFTYSWPDLGTTSSTISNVSAGSYSVVVEDAFGCVMNETAEVSQPNQIEVTNSTQPSSCNINNGSATVFVTGGTSPYSYLWSNNSQTPTATNLPAGIHTFSVLDNNGCLYQGSVNVENTTPPALEVTNLQHVSCNGLQDGSIEVSVSGLFPSFTYSWLPNVGNTPNIANLSAGSYTLNVQDQVGCSSQIVVTVSEPDALDAFITSSDIINGNDGTVSLTVSGGTSPYSYLWSGPGGFISTDQDLTDLNSAGEYIVVVSDANGCEFDVSATLDSQLGLIEDELMHISTYPNPNNGQFTIDFGELKEKVVLIILDAQGRSLHSETIYNSSAKEILMNVERGVYTLYMSIEGVIVHSKISVK